MPIEMCTYHEMLNGRPDPDCDACADAAGWTDRTERINA